MVYVILKQQFMDDSYVVGYTDTLQRAEELVRQYTDQFNHERSIAIAKSDLVNKFLRDWEEANPMPMMPHVELQPERATMNDAELKQHYKANAQLLRTAKQAWTDGPVREWYDRRQIDIDAYVQEHFNPDKCPPASQLEAVFFYEIAEKL